MPSNRRDFLKAAGAFGLSAAFPAAAQVSHSRELLWRRGMKLYEWRELPNTSMKHAFKPAWSPNGSRGWRNVLHAWVGASIDTRDSTVYTLCPGGHSIGRSNFVLKLRMSVDHPVMEEAAPTSPPEMICTETLASGTKRQCRVNLDGRPPSQHSYDNNQFDEVNNRALSIRATALAPTGNYPMVISYNPEKGDYDPDGTYPDFPLKAVPDSPTCKDLKTGKIYGWVHNYGVWAVFDPHSKKWTRLPNTELRISSCVVSADHRRRRIVTPQWPFNKHGRLKKQTIPFYVDLDTFQCTPITFGGMGPVVGNPALFGQTHQRSWAMPFVEHTSDPSQDAFFLKRLFGDGKNHRVYRLNAETFEISEVPVIGGEAIRTPRNLTGKIIAGTLYNKFLYAPQYGVCVLIPGGWEDNAWVLRVI